MILSDRASVHLARRSRQCQLLVEADIVQQARPKDVASFRGAYGP
jgi:hypothetical protein